MSTTSVLYVRRRDAKAIKSHLEDLHKLDKRFRMVPTTPDATIHDDSMRKCVNDDEDIKAEILSGGCIAVPVVELSFASLNEYSWASKIVGFGTHHCPFSTSMGNSNRVASSSPAVAKARSGTSCTNNAQLNDVQHALAETLVSYYSPSDRTHEQEDHVDSYRTNIVQSVLTLSARTCPKKLEVMGDDRTLVIPRWSFYIFEANELEVASTLGKHEGANEFCQLLIQYKLQSESVEEACGKIQSLLWENLARTHRSHRVVRRGDIDPESGVRESGHRILWPQLSSQEPIDFNKGFTPSTTGAGSPGWITVTEHQISQSFDLTRVMFSRGNVTEKKRFASLVQTGERVLDMYAGIGYYTLPALVHGKAKHVTSCEWNPHAFYALKYNLLANGVDKQTTVLEGDCRVSLRTLLDSEDETNKYFDRVSLGLLPSSEGGWSVAIACLNPSTGGWLHIHGNVPTAERQNWSYWVCQSLKYLTENHVHSKEWHVVCTHVEKVKSFAPLVDHVVADVFVGPLNSTKIQLKSISSSGVINSFGDFNPVKVGDISPPSCALSKDGVLHQDWLRS